MIQQLLFLGLGAGVLYFGAEALVRGAARLAAGIGVSPIVIGLTVVSLGTSAPELVVCIFAALGGSGDLAVGNVLGSNLANVGLVLGLAAIFSPLTVAARVVSREVPIMVAVTALLYPLVLDGFLSRPDGLVLLGCLTAYLIFVTWTAGMETPEVIDEYEEFARESAYVTSRSALRDFGMVVVGSAGVVVGGQLIVENAVALATAAGLSELVVGLSVVAVGTSLPELATAVVAAVREEADIAVGNVIGSNIFNVAAVLGATALVRPISVAGSILTVELPAVLALSLLIFLIALRGFEIRRWEGAVLLTGYGVAGLLVFT